MFLNVIIPSYRAGATIAGTLESVQANREHFDGEFDITVVDSSDDDTPEIIQASGIDVRLVRLPYRAFPGAARNRGALETSGDVLCFIDADAYADEHWLREIHDFLEKNPNVAAVGGPVLNANPEDRFSRLAHWCEFSGYGLRAPEGRRRVQPTVNVAIRRAVFEKYGPFLEDQFGNEDVLLFQRMKQAGEKLYFNRKIRAHHLNKVRLDLINMHQYYLGGCTGRARVKYELPGSFLARPGFSFLIPFVKTHFICWRLLTQETGEFPSYLVNWPLVFMAMWWFTLGFQDGVRKAREEKT